MDTLGVATHQILAGAWEDPDWSPDGTRLALSRGGIYSVPATGGSPQAIAPKGSRPRWSPAGNRLAFRTVDTTGTGTIWLVSQDGTGLQSLAPTGTESWNAPDWSPDGTRLVHTRRDSAFVYIFVMDTTGHAEERITTGMYDNYDYAPTWSPDGQWIAWSLRADGGTVWLVRPDGTGARALTLGENPSWSPDSRRIVFTRLMFNIVRLFTIDLATSQVRQITQ